MENKQKMDFYILVHAASSFVLCSTLGVFSKKEFLSLESAIELKSA